MHGNDHAVAVGLLRPHRTLLLALTDVTAWIVAIALVTAVPLAGVEKPTASTVLMIGLLLGLLHVLVCRLLRLHQGRARTASLEEMLYLGAVTTVIGGVLVLANLDGGWLPLVMAELSVCAALVLMGSARAAWRLLRPGMRRRTGVGTATLVIGAGEAGRDLVASMQRDPAGDWMPVALLDDDPRKRYLRLGGVPVVGTTADLVNALERTGAAAVVIAIPSAPTEMVDRLRVALAAIDPEMPVKVLPSTAQLLDTTPGVRDIRDIDITDYLGRSQLDTDVAAIAGYLAGRRVLVTGAGGSIGSELCRQIAGFDPAELMMLDRDESALHAVQLSLTDRALLDSDEVILCDIRDAAAVRRVLRERRPEVVFHAAALKHLPMLERYPAEAVKTNVWGTRHLLEACEEVGVERFVNISTDKAADPSCVLGTSKRVGERLTAASACRTSSAYLSVRFGNVIGSRGSVLTTFTRQIARGGPVTVTHPQVTRFFMTVEEACQLVVQAAAIGEPGEVLVLDMGESVSIDLVARQLIDYYGPGAEVEYTGLRDGEKLHEQLFAGDEPQDSRPRHPLISHVPVPPLAFEAVGTLPVDGSDDCVRQGLAQLCRVGVTEMSVAPAVSAVATVPVAAGRVPA